MITFCRVRDYHEGEYLPSSKGFIEVKPNCVLRCKYPDEFDNDEFNLILYFGRERIRARSIDFSFYETRKQAEKEIREELRNESN